MTLSRIVNPLVVQHGRTLALSMVLSLGILGPHQMLSAQTGQQTEDRHELRAFYSANGLLNRGLYDLAIDEYRAFLDTHGDHVKADTARYGLGVCLFRLQRYDEARSTLNEIRDQDATGFASEIRLMCGQASLAQRQYDRAIPYFEELIQRAPDHSLADDAAAMLLEAEYRSARHAERPRLEARFKGEWKDSPMRDRAELFVGLSQMARASYAQAARSFQALNERNPGNAHRQQVLLLEAQCLQRAKSIPEAMRKYQRVLADNASPYIADALFGLSAILQEQGQSGEAAELLERLAREFPDHRLTQDAALVRGRALFDLKKYDEAEAVFASLERSDRTPKDAIAYWRAKCDLRQGEIDSSIARLRAARQAHPESSYAAEMSYDLAVALVRADDREAAIPVLREFLSAHRGHALNDSALHLLAASFHAVGSYEDSATACSAYLRTFPQGKHATAVTFLQAENSYLGGDFVEAASRFESFIDDHQDASEREAAIFRLGMSLYRTDAFDEAESWLEQTVQRDGSQPSFRAATLALGDIRFQYRQWADAIQLLDRYLATTEADATHAEARLKLGIAHLRNDDPETAVATLTQLINESDDEVILMQAHFERGQALVEVGSDARARDDFLFIAEQHPESRFASHACNHLGAIETRLGSAESAAQWYARAADASGDDAARGNALLQQARSLMAARRYEAAATAYAAFLDVTEDSALAAEARAQRCVALARLDRHEEAIALGRELANEGLDELPLNLHAAVLYECAWSFKSLNDAEGARGAYGALLQLDGELPIRSNAMVELAELEVAAGNQERATELLSQVVSTLESDDALHQQALYRHAALLYGQKSFGPAADQFAAYLERYPDSDDAASVHLLCGEAYFRAASLQKAVTHLESVVTKYPKSDSTEMAFLRLGECRAALQHWPRSAEAFRKHRERYPESKQWYQAAFGLGWALENQGRLDDAMAEYASITERHDGATAARAQFQIGECLYAREQHEEAIRAFLKVDILYAYPEWAAAALYEAGRCFEALKNPVEAKRHYELVLERASESNWADLAQKRIAALSRSGLPGRGE